MLDSNDNTPIFSKEEYSYIVEENTGVGYKIGVTQATDADSGQNGQLLLYYFLLMIIVILSLL